MKKLEIKAPAKINIGLNVVGKRTDGYHNIETVFFPLDLSDIITIESSDSFAFDCGKNKAVDPEDNSVVNAVRLIEKKAGIKLNIKVSLGKNIPVGAGLGGGSSDGGTMLTALNEFFNMGLKSEDLLELALQLGSDVPFFINPCPAYAFSRGEKIIPLNFKIPYPVLLINPGIHVSTKWAYGTIKPMSSRTNLMSFFDKEEIDLRSLINTVTNDFEPAVFGKFPEIKSIKEILYKSGALFSLMTGSGSTVFGIFENLKLAEKARSNFPRKYFTYINPRLR